MCRLGVCTGSEPQSYESDENISLVSILIYFSTYGDMVHIYKRRPFFAKNDIFQTEETLKDLTINLYWHSDGTIVLYHCIGLWQSYEDFFFKIIIFKK